MITYFGQLYALKLKKADILKVMNGQRQIILMLKEFKCNKKLGTILSKVAINGSF